MKPSIILALAVTALAILLQVFCPWWVSIILILGVGISLNTTPGKSFAFGLVVLFIAWMGPAIFKNYGANISVADSIGELIGGLSGIVVYLLTGLIGGIMGGMTSMTGTFFRKIILEGKEVN